MGEGLAFGVLSPFLRRKRFNGCYTLVLSSYLSAHGSIAAYVALGQRDDKYYIDFVENTHN